MAVEVVMPRLGWTMETGALVEWLKQDGDEVRVGDLLFTVESDKTVHEVESFESGILRIPPDSPSPGVPLPIGAVLAYLVQPGETAPFEVSGWAATTPALAPDSFAAAVPERPTAAEAPARRGLRPAISPRARRVAAELGVEWAALRGSGRRGRIVERDIRAALAAPPTPAVRVSPLARRVAEAHGVDVTTLAAAQPGQRIARADVEAAVRTTPGGSPPHITPMTQTRRVIAARMAESARTTAPVTLTTEADATELVRLRDQIKADQGGEGIVPTYTDLLAKILAVTLAEHPTLNAALDGESIVQHDAVHLALAVDTERGLLVPVVRDVQAKSVQRIAEEAAALTERARAGTLSGDDLRGATFTLTNLGMYDIDAFTPIIQLPACAILGMGRIVARPVVVDATTEVVAVRRMMALSLTFDHRLVDGGPAARFLQRVKRLVEQPYLWLIG